MFFLNDVIYRASDQTTNNTTNTNTQNVKNKIPSTSEIVNRVIDEVQSATSSAIINNLKLSQNNSLTFVLFIVPGILLFLCKSVIRDKIEYITEYHGDPENKLFFLIFVIMHGFYFFLLSFYVLQFKSVATSSLFWVILVIAALLLILYAFLFIFMVLFIIKATSAPVSLKWIFNWIIHTVFVLLLCFYITQYLNTSITIGFSIALAVCVGSIIINFLIGKLYDHIIFAMEKQKQTPDIHIDISSATTTTTTVESKTDTTIKN